MSTLESDPGFAPHAHKVTPEVHIPTVVSAPKRALERLTLEFHTRHEELLALSGRWRLEQTPESCRAYTLALEALVAWAIRVDTVGVH